jgi:hypothetical protein
MEQYHQLFPRSRANLSRVVKTTIKKNLISNIKNLAIKLQSQLLYVL